MNIVLKAGARSTEEISKLNQEAAYLRNSPITEASQMPRPMVCDQIDEDWLGRINERWWGTGYQGDPLLEVEEAKRAHMRGVLQLRDRLLTFGGEQACMPVIEEDLEKLMSRGQFWYGDKIRMKKGRPSQCHKNSCDLWAANKGRPGVRLHIATGYAITEDGMWRQHSWLVWIKPRSIQIVETTERRIGYFGFVMMDEEAATFDEANL